MTPLLSLTTLAYLTSTVLYLLYLFRQAEQLHKSGLIAFAVGFGLHTLLILAAFVHAGSLPVHNLHQNLSLAAWTLSGGFLLLFHRYRLRVLGVYAAPLVCAVMVLSLRMPVEPETVEPNLRSLWVFFHVLLIFLGEAAFALACGVGILYLLQERAIKTKQRGFFYKRLPSLDLLDTIGYACIISGFTLLTVGLIGGFVYAKLVWGRMWSWDPKEVWSAVAWIFYAVLLHERLAVGWRGRKSAIMAIIGFFVLIFTFLGVNILFHGHHGEFTQW